MTRAELIPEIMKLTTRDQFLIAQTIRENLGQKGGEEEAEFKRELDRRFADFLANPTDEISWDDLSRELDRV